MAQNKLKLYNTLTREKETFNPREKGEINIFVCGPTVYDYSHIGHARTYISFDVIVKYLRRKGFDVFYLQNITDVDDKIIKRSRERKMPWNELAIKFEKEYLKDMETLKVDSVNRYARATDHIPEIISQVERLLEKGFAYHIEDGIYYDISQFKDYGKLSGRTAQMAEDAVSRIDEGKEKRSKGDFCLWKFSKPHEPKWESPWGLGRPGWHIEDTAITEKFFGPQYDIHGGARDLIFPHHEAEISQMEAISGKEPLVRYWVHTGFLTIEGRKMSKSLGNFITIRDFLDDHSPNVLRLLVAKTHYRSPVDFSKKLISQVKQEMKRINEFSSKVYSISEKNSLIAGRGQEITSKMVIDAKEKFEEAMDDDFNTPVAIASLFDLINQGNKLIASGKITNQQVSDILNFLEEVESVFSLGLSEKKEIKIPQKVRNLIKQREEYREEEKWEKADEVRKQIEELGFLIKDTSSGPEISRKD